MHRDIDPAILYFGTPVVLVSTSNPDGSANLAPISSVWWLGWNALLGFGASSRTPENLLREGECVLNLPSVAEVDAVDRLARTTGSDPVPGHKLEKGYRHVGDKFAHAGLTAWPSLDVRPPRVAECPVQMEARLGGSHRIAERIAEDRGRLIAIEVQILRVHVAPSIVLERSDDRIDPAKWRPLIMSFCEFYGLGEQVRPSTLAEIPESLYRPASRRNRAVGATVSSRPGAHLR